MATDDVNVSFGIDPTGAEQGGRRIARTIDMLEEKLRDLDKAFNAVEKAMSFRGANGGGQSPEARLNATAKAVANLRSSMQAYAGATVKALQQISTQANNTGKAVNGLGSEFNKLARVASFVAGPLTGIGSRIRAAAGGIELLGGVIAGTVAGLAGLAVVATKAVKAFLPFEQALARLSALNPEITGSALDELGQKALLMSRNTTSSAVEVVTAFRLLAARRPDLLTTAGAIEAVAKQALILSQASGETVADATKTLATALNQFGVSAADAADKSEHFVNVLAEAGRLGAAEIPDLGDALAKTGSLAGSLGISLEETAAALEILAKSGLPATETGTALRNILSRLSRAAEDFNPALQATSDTTGRLAEALRHIGDAGLTANQFFKLFGARQQNLALLLLNNVDALNELFQQLEKAPGAMSQAARATQDTADDWTKFKNSVDALLISLGSELAPAVDIAIRELKRLSDALNDRLLIHNGGENLVAKNFVDNLIDGIKAQGGNLANGLTDALVKARQKLDPLLRQQEQDVESLNNRPAANRFNVVEQLSLAFKNADVGKRQQSIDVLTEEIDLMEKAIADLGKTAGQEAPKIENFAGDAPAKLLKLNEELRQTQAEFKAFSDAGGTLGKDPLNLASQAREAEKIRQKIDEIFKTAQPGGVKAAALDFFNIKSQKDAEGKTFFPITVEQINSYQEAVIKAAVAQAQLNREMDASQSASKKAGNSLETAAARSKAALDKFEAQIKAQQQANEAGFAGVPGDTGAQKVNRKVLEDQARLSGVVVAADEARKNALIDLDREVATNTQNLKEANDAAKAFATFDDDVAKIKAHTAALQVDEDAQNRANRLQELVINLERDVAAARKDGIAVTQDSIDAKKREAAAALDADLAATKVVEAEREAQKARAAAVREPLLQAVRNIQDAFANMFENIFDGGVKSFKDLGSEILTIMKKTAAQIIAAKIFQPVLEQALQAGKGTQTSSTANNGFSGFLSQLFGHKTTDVFGQGAAATQAQTNAIEQNTAVAQSGWDDALATWNEAIGKADQQTAATEKVASNTDGLLSQVGGITGVLGTLGAGLAGLAGGGALGSQFGLKGGAGSLGGGLLGGVLGAIAGPPGAAAGSFLGSLLGGEFLGGATDIFSGRNPFKGQSALSGGVRGGLLGGIAGGAGLGAVGGPIGAIVGAVLGAILASDKQRQQRGALLTRPGASGQFEGGFSLGGPFGNVGFFGPLTKRIEESAIQSMTKLVQNFDATIAATIGDPKLFDPIAKALQSAPINQQSATSFGNEFSTLLVDRARTILGVLLKNVGAANPEAFLKGAGLSLQGSGNLKPEEAISKTQDAIKVITAFQQGLETLKGNTPSDAAQALKALDDQLASMIPTAIALGKSVEDLQKAADEGRQKLRDNFVKGLERETLKLVDPFSEAVLEIQDRRTELLKQVTDFGVGLGQVNALIAASTKDLVDQTLAPIRSALKDIALDVATPTQALDQLDAAFKQTLTGTDASAVAASAQELLDAEQKTFGRTGDFLAKQQQVQDALNAFADRITGAAFGTLGLPSSFATSSLLNTLVGDPTNSAITSLSQQLALQNSDLLNAQQENTRVLESTQDEQATILRSLRTSMDSNTAAITKLNEKLDLTIAARGR